MYSFSHRGYSCKVLCNSHMKKKAQMIEATFASSEIEYSYVLQREDE